MIPTVIGAVVMIYNLPNINNLVLTRDLIADIYLGKVKSWNDPKIRAVNKDLNLPNMPIIVARRSDGSGTTAILPTFFLL